jgi:hypothetical protein
MPRGGKRRGAGRKRGRLNNRTIAHKELASAAAQEGLRGALKNLTKDFRCRAEAKGGEQGENGVG